DLQRSGLHLDGPLTPGQLGRNHEVSIRPLIARAQNAGPKREISLFQSNMCRRFHSVKLWVCVKTKLRARSRAASKTFFSLPPAGVYVTRHWRMRLLFVAAMPSLLRVQLQPARALRPQSVSRIEPSPLCCAFPCPTHRPTAKRF